jgi:hypothetical protein
MCGRVRLNKNYSGIKFRLKFAPDAPAPSHVVGHDKPTHRPNLSHPPPGRARAEGEEIDG